MTYACLGLGSCVALCLSDAEAKVSGVAHIMLPEAFDQAIGDRPAKFADTGFAHFLNVLKDQGANPSSIKAIMVGGAQVLHGKTVSSTMEFGVRNVHALRELLREHGIPLVASDVGGSQGRTMIYDSRSGAVTVRTAASPDRVIGNFF
jgi:chemotaxis protein CheD